MRARFDCTVADSCVKSLLGGYLPSSNVIMDAVRLKLRFRNDTHEARAHCLAVGSACPCRLRVTALRGPERGRAFEGLFQGVSGRSLSPPAVGSDAARRASL